MNNNSRFQPEVGGLSVNGIRFGYSRRQVEQVLGPPSDCASPAWNRYGLGRQYVVLYRPEWPRLSPESWQVQLVLGDTLEQDGNILIRRGDSQQSVRAVLGSPVEECQTGPNTALMEYHDFYVTFDLKTGTALDIGLKKYCEKLDTKTHRDHRNTPRSGAIAS